MRPAHTLSVAPMMDCTDRHFRWLARRISRRVQLYTEMVVAGTILHHRDDGLLDRYIGFDPSEHPVAIQLGGDDPGQLAIAARVAAERGYDEINLNVGCPSDRVRDGCFGAVLMRTPERVAECVAAMRDAVDVPVTVKHRIGVDDLDRYEDMARFVEIVAAAGCDTFIVHARKAWLKGLSPKQNRTVPPLRHAEVRHLKRDFPALTIVTNGGITTLDEVEEHLAHVDGVMMGRGAYENPLVLVDADLRIFGDAAAPDFDVDAFVEETIGYAHAQLAAGTRLHIVVRPLLGMFHGRPGARRWRRFLSEHVQGRDAEPEVLRDALAHMRGAHAAA